MLIWMKKCLCKQACNTLSHSNQRMAELSNKILQKPRINHQDTAIIKL